MASSRAVLSDHFLDENEIEEQMYKMGIADRASNFPSIDNAKPTRAGHDVCISRKKDCIQRELVSISFVTVKSPSGGHIKMTTSLLQGA